MPIAEILGQILVNPPLIGLMLAEVGRYLGRFIIFGMAFYYFKVVITSVLVSAGYEAGKAPRSD
jgi:mannose/fructose/N-acetylgalactosamine-specific phosphotransferase system component IID